MSAADFGMLLFLVSIAVVVVVVVVLMVVAELPFSYLFTCHPNAPPHRRTSATAAAASLRRLGYRRQSRAARAPCLLRQRPRRVALGLRRRRLPPARRVTGPRSNSMSKLRRLSGKWATTATTTNHHSPSRPSRPSRPPSPSNHHVTKIIMLIYAALLTHLRPRTFAHAYFRTHPRSLACIGSCTLVRSCSGMV